jgi:hypothetical protein
MIEAPSMRLNRSGGFVDQLIAQYHKFLGLGPKCEHACVSLSGNNVWVLSEPILISPSAKLRNTNSASVLFATPAVKCVEPIVIKAMTRHIACALLALIIVVVSLLGQGRAATLMTPDDWSGSWHGIYVCAQGVTGLTLSIKPSGLRNVSATFSFYAVPHNPSVPSGEFAMVGRLEHTGHLDLHATAWRMQPRNYLTVDLDGDYDPMSGEYRGHVHGPGCGLFHLRRDLVS